MKLKSITKLRLAWGLLILVDLVWVIILSTYSTTPQVAQLEPCFSLVDDNEKQYYQWSSDQPHLPFQKGQWRWNTTPPFSLPYPNIERLQNKPVRLARLSESPIKEQGHLAILYDDWSKLNQLQNPLRPITTQDLNTILFIDQSATMNSPWAASTKSAYEVSLDSLLQKRKSEAQTWDIITFGSNWKNQGKWSPNQNFPLQSMGKPSGKTKWSEALEAWIKTNPEPSHLIMVGDGKIEERNLQRLQDTLELIKNKGHQITVLSPDLKALDNWSTLYQQQIIHDHWPQTKAEEQTSPIMSQHPTTSNWSNVTQALAGKGHTPLIWSNEGYLLMSLETADDGPIYHLAGEPSIDPLELIGLIQKNNQQPIFLELYANRLIIDFHSNSKAPLTLTSNRGESYVWPKQWGIYELTELNNVLSLTHPQYGILKITNTLDFQNRIFPSQKTKALEALKHSSAGATFNIILALAHLATLIATTIFIKKHSHA